MKMRNIYLLMCLIFTLTVNAQKPFEELGLDNEVELLTLSDGRYVEHFTNDTLRQIGSVMFNTVTNKVAYFIADDELEKMNVANRNREVSRFMSIDPYESTFSGVSPYTYALNNPIRNIDTEGLWPLDANLKIIIGNFNNEPIVTNGDWTEIRASSLEEALKIMQNGKLETEKFDNLFISTHGDGYTDKGGGFMTGGGENITNIELSRFFNKGVSSKQLLAFSNILNYLGKNPEIVLGSCNSANSESFNKLIYQYIEDKLGKGFSLYASTGLVKNPLTLENKDYGLVSPHDILKGFGFRKIQKNGERSEETFNLRLETHNPWLSGIFNFSSISGTSNLKSDDTSNLSTETDSGSSENTSNSSDNSKKVYKVFKSDPNDQ